jgi:hypothetical protein
MPTNPDRILHVQITPSRRLRFLTVELHKASGERAYVYHPNDRDGGYAVSPSFPDEPNGVLVNMQPVKVKTWDDFLSGTWRQRAAPVRLQPMQRWFGKDTRHFLLSSAGAAWFQSFDKSPRLLAKIVWASKRLGSGGLRNGRRAAQFDAKLALNEKIQILLAVVVGIMVLITVVLIWPTLWENLHGAIPKFGK